MNLILLSKDDFMLSGSKVRLTGRRHKHILEILKASVQDELCVGLAGGKIGTGRITSIDKTALEMDVKLDKDPPAALPLTLILALPRPIVFRRLLAQITALGVKKIIVIHSQRVEKSYWNSPALDHAAIEEQLILGLEQARDTIMPEVILRQSFKKFVDNELPGRIKNSKAFIAHPGVRERLTAYGKGPVTLVIGPDGGFLPQEVERFVEAGCSLVSLGDRILRVETAVIASIARLMK